MKIRHLDIKSTAYEIKYKLNWINARLDTAEKKISKLEETAKERIQNTRTETEKAGRKGTKIKRGHGYHTVIEEQMEKQAEIVGM